MVRPSQFKKNSNLSHITFSGVSIEDTFNMFSNHYLDALFKPQWERFGIDFLSKKMIGNHKNGIPAEKNHKSSTSACCIIV